MTLDAVVVTGGQAATLVPASSVPSITVIILTFNEARHIERAIASVRDIARDVVIVDSFSTDDTCARAAAAGARVLQNKWENYSRQFQWGIDNAQVITNWILRLDADEVIEPDLVLRITQELSMLPADVSGVNFERRHVFMGRWIRHGGRYPLRLLRLWRTGRGRIEDRWMDEHIVIEGGRTITMKGGFSDINLNDLTFFTDKHNNYATREAIDALNLRYALFARDEALDTASTSLQASLKRALKERVYNKLPIWAGPAGYFLYRYFLQLGFLDGRPGFTYHLLQAFWYRFLVAAKIQEYERELTKCTGREAKRARLAELTQQRL